MQQQVPTSITLDQQVAAVTAFCEALGINPRAAYFPLVVTETHIHLPMALSDGDERRPSGLPAGRLSPQGNDSDELSVMVTIGVER